MSLRAWKSIDVAMPVTVTEVDGETFAGNLFLSTRISFVVLGEHKPRRFHWPARSDRVRADTANGTVRAGDQLTWHDYRPPLADRTLTLTIRTEPRP